MAVVMITGIKHSTKANAHAQRFAQRFSFSSRCFSSIWAWLMNLDTLAVPSSIELGDDRCTPKKSVMPPRAQKRGKTARDVRQPERRERKRTEANPEEPLAGRDPVGPFIDLGYLFVVDGVAIHPEGPLMH